MVWHALLASCLLLGAYRVYRERHGLGPARLSLLLSRLSFALTNLMLTAHTRAHRESISNHALSRSSRAPRRARPTSVSSASCLHPPIIASPPTIAYPIRTSCHHGHGSRARGFVKRTTSTYLSSITAILKCPSDGAPQPDEGRFAGPRRSRGSWPP